MLAPSYEKAFHKALQRAAAGDSAGALALFREAAEKDQGDKHSPMTSLPACSAPRLKTT